MCAPDIATTCKDDFDKWIINNSCRRRHVCRAMENLIAIEPTRSNDWVNPGHLADTIH